MKHIAAIAALALSSGMVQGGSMSAEKLKSDLASRDTTLYAHSMGYILGSVDTMSGAVICPPNGMKSREIAQRVFNWLNTNQNRLEDVSADEAIFAALAPAWPCRSNSRGGQPMT